MEWDSIEIGPDVTPLIALKLQREQKPVQLQAGAAAEPSLENLLAPFQTGPYNWPAQICYWQPEQLQEICNQQANMVYSVMQGPGRRQESLARADLNRRLRTAAGTQAPAAADSGLYSNALLLHVTGRHADMSIYLLLVPHASPDPAGAPCELVFWAYFLLLEAFSIEDKLQMYKQPGVCPLRVDAVLRSLRRAKRKQEMRQWQACADYQMSYGRQPSGLPQWLKNVTLQGHLRLAAPAGQLDLVDRCYLRRSDCSEAGSSGGGAGAGHDASVPDACASQEQHVWAGCTNLKPLSVGPIADFTQKCMCPADMWCQGMQGRQQLVQLWLHEHAPRLHIKPCSGNRGLGLFAGQFMQVASTVCEYNGELIPKKEMQRREQLYHGMQPSPLLYVWAEANLPPSLALNLQQEQQQAQQQQQQQLQQQHAGGKRGGGPGGRAAKVAARAVEQMAIDATFVGGVARFMNHSCDPNCRAVLVCCGQAHEEAQCAAAGEPRTGVMLVLIQTIRDVQEGEELTFNYSARATWEEGQLRQWDGTGKMPGLVKCACGAGDKCSGVVFWFKK